MKGEETMLAALDRLEELARDMDQELQEMKAELRKNSDMVLLNTLLGCGREMGKFSKEPAPGDERFRQYYRLKTESVAAQEVLLERLYAYRLPQSGDIAKTDQFPGMKGEMVPVSVARLCKSHAIATCSEGSTQELERVPIDSLTFVSRSQPRS